MKFYVIALAVAIFLSSCLKQSIPDAMLDSGKSGHVTATLSYKINGNTVNISVNDADNQNTYPYYTLGCTKEAGYYSLSGISNAGETSFVFYTDSLAVGNYKYSGSYGDMFFIDYYNTAEYVHAPSDSMSFNITSYNNGHISGNFSGMLTPLITASTINNIFGDPGSVLITNGSFENVPVFY
ncbi:MAG: hypothetical protein ABI594_05540 [Ginsengibacter sp.]